MKILTPGTYISDTPASSLLLTFLIAPLFVPWTQSSGDLPDPGTELRSPALQADSLTSESPGSVVQKQLNHVQSCQW